MIITYLGKQFFKISQGDLVLAFNPISKDSRSGVSPSRFGSAIAFSTINHPDYNGFEMVTHGDTVPFEVRGPGDYEIKDIFIKGILTNTELGGKKYINTIYSLSVENISICFLGVISDAKLSSEVIGQIESPDILFVPGSDNIGYTASKIYSYVWFHKPLLTLFHSSSSVNTFMNECNVGMDLQFDKDSESIIIDKIMSYLLEAIKGANTKEVNWVAFEKYTAQHQVKKQIDLFNNVIINDCK